jgi:predicted CXXCH cytochrome family protein
MRTGSRPMKKLLFLGVGSALIFTMGGIGSAQADNGPHVQGVLTAGMNASNVATDRCAACHRAHTSQGADNLLQDQNQICSNCHGPAGTGSGLDVQNGVAVAPATPGALNAGGFANAEIDSLNAAKDEEYPLGTNGLPDTTQPLSANKLTEQIPVLGAPVATTSSHQIGIPGTEWGNGPISASAISGATSGQVTLQCASCHNPHGNGNYDILIPMPTKAVAAVGTTPAVAATLGVNIPQPTSHVYTTTNYWLSGDSTVPADQTGMGVTPKNPQVAYTNGATAPIVGVDGFIQDVAAWCAQCHTRLLAPSGSASVSSGDATFTYRHTSNENYKEIGGPNCITCHVAHGSNAVMTTGGNSAGVSTMSPTTTSVPSLAGNSFLLRVADRGTCQMCHTK